MASPDLAVRLTPAGPDDLAFMYRLFKAVKTDELQAWHWGEAERDLILGMQFKGHEHHYRQELPDAEDVLIRLDGEPVGRLIVQRGPDAFLLADISVLPEYRNRGIGARLIGDLQREAAAAGVPVRLHCASANRAGGLYQRLGFAVVGENATHRLMEWRAPRSA